MEKTTEKIARLLLSGLFIYGGALHVFDPAEMRRAIEGYQWVGGVWAIIGAYVIPWLEVWAGVGLFFKKFRPASALIIFGLMAIFTVATIWAWIRGIDLNCGCFGHMAGESPDDYRWLLARDVGILFLAGVIFRASFLKEKR